MYINFLRGLGIIGAVVAAPFATATAQVYDAPAGDVIQAEVSQSVSTVVASTVAAGVSSAIASVASGITPPPVNVQTSQGPVTRYFEGGNRGKSAGAREKKAGVWILGSFSNIENDNVNTAFDGDIVNVVGGVDYRFTDRFIAGIAVSFEQTDLDTTFNLGTFDIDGIGVMPYAAFVLNDKFSIDASVGFTQLDFDTTRTLAVGGTATGSYEGDRFTSGVNLNYNNAIKNWRVGASVGFLYIKEESDAFTEVGGLAVAENTVSIGQGRASARVGYNFGKIQPYLAVRLENEFWAPSDAIINGTLVENDTSGVVVTGGLDFALSDAVSGGLSVSSQQDRDNLDLYTVSGRIRVAF